MAIEVKVDAGTLRAEIARARLPRYKVAAAADLHPTTLSQILSERVPLRQDLARRIMRVVAQSIAEGRAR
jgi:hypothetical protein